MFYEDLTEYSQLPGTPKALNIGWLGSDRSFRRGSVPKDFLETLWKFCRVLVHPARGWHDCEFCPRKTPAEGPLKVSCGAETGELGFAEIRVFGNNGTTFAAPNLVYHFVREHRYRPPDAFVSAVLSGVHPFSDEYIRRLHSHGVRYWHYDATGEVRVAPYGTA